MMNVRKLLVCAAVAVVLAAAPAAAAISVDIGVLWNPNPNDDMQVALHVTNVVFPQYGENLGFFRQIQNPYEDYPVLAFIAHRAEVEPEVVWEYKKKGHKWSAVMVHFGVPPDSLFVELPKSPGPPYGNAYGYWKKQRDRMPVEQISNEDIRFWVGLHTLAAYTGQSLASVYQWDPSGRKFPQVAAARYREKHGQQHQVQQAGMDGSGKGKGKGHDKEKH